MERTTYFNLNKPSLNDQVAVSDLNQNMDILDSNVHRVDLTNGGTVRGGQLNIQDGSSLHVYCSDVQGAIVAHDTTNMNGILVGSKNDSTGAGCYTNVSDANEGLYYYGKDSGGSGWLIRHNESTGDTVIGAPSGKNIWLAQPPIFKGLEYSTSGLTFASGVSLSAGGYCKMGNLCIVNLRLTVSTSISSKVNIVAGLPKYAAITGSNIVPISYFYGDKVSAYLSSAGNIYGTALGTGNLFIQTVYLCNE